MGSFDSAPSCTPLNYVAIHVHVYLLMCMHKNCGKFLGCCIPQRKCWVKLSPQINWKSKLTSCLSNSTPDDLLLLQHFLSQQYYSQNLQFVSVWAFLLFCFYFVAYYMITAGSLETSETKIYQNVFCWAHFICSKRVSFLRTESPLLIYYLTYYPKVARYMFTIQNPNYMGLEGWLYD